MLKYWPHLTTRAMYVSRSVTVDESWTCLNEHSSGSGIGPRQLCRICMDGSIYMHLQAFNDLLVTVPSFAFTASKLYYLDPASMTPKLILVLGATGAQGLAVVDALLAPAPDGSPSPYTIRALTRDPASKRALDLKSKGVELVLGLPIPSGHFHFSSRFDNVIPCFILLFLAAAYCGPGMKATPMIWLPSSRPCVASMVHGSTSMDLQLESRRKCGRA